MANQIQETVSTTLGSAVGNGASFNVSYPANRSAKYYLGGARQRLRSDGIRTLHATAGEFLIAFGSSNMTVTLTTGIALPLGAVVYLDLDRAESDTFTDDLASPSKMMLMQTVALHFGAPATASANAIVLSQACTAAGGLATGINGALAASGVATIPTPRNVVAAWTNTAVVTIEGFDEYGVKLTESSASGTSLTGKKAFARVTKVTTSADITGLTVGTGNVLGLPVFLPDLPSVLKELQDGTAPTAGTFVAGDQTAATATTGDVRGTWAPNATPNGTRVYEAIVALRSIGYKGRAQA